MCADGLRSLRRPRKRASGCATAFRASRPIRGAALATSSTFPSPANLLIHTGGHSYVEPHYSIRLGLNAGQDISARSPISRSSHEIPTRQSLDSARFQRLPRSAIDRSKSDRPTSTVEEAFEDVGLDDQKQQVQSPHPRKRGFFSKFSDEKDKDAATQGSVSRFLNTGRKRGQSGQGAELGNMEHPKVVVTQDGQDRQ